jgi:4-alpha-glucanotransferase
MARDATRSAHNVRLARRGAGLLLHVTSLPAPYGVGDLGPSAYRWVDALARAGQTFWQTLPLTPPGEGDSPYQAFSAFAGNPLLISPDALVHDGLLGRADLVVRFGAGRVNYREVAALKARLLALAWERFGGGAGRRLRTAFERFRQAETSWLDDYTLFMALRDAHEGKTWTDWSGALIRRDRWALDSARRELADVIGRHAFAQFLFHRQLAALRAHAKSRGVKLVGDLPIFVSYDSADVWANPHLFQLDRRRRRPAAVAGVPPDAFTDTGQRWGNPLYDWDAMRRDGYAWWAARLRAALAQADLVRVDHFRGFEAYWRVPASSPTAAKGRWVKGPGRELFDALRTLLGELPLIAEDLGVITPPVEALRDSLGFPGMRVLQFAFGGDATNPHLPHNHVPNSVAYTGTHDNDTTAGWFATLPASERARVRRYVPEATSPKTAAWALIRETWKSVASIAIAPVQDVLNLGSAARMNTPGTATGNWRWRADRLDPGAWVDELADLTRLYGRTLSS